MSEDPRGRRRAVLVAVDRSESSSRVVEFVNRFFVDLDVEVIGINVGSETGNPMLTGPALGTSFSWPYGAVPDLPTEEEQQRRVSEAEAELESTGLDTDKVVIELGDPVDRICAVAVEHAVELIVIGDDHRSAWRRLLEGSVISDVQHHAPCPVLVVP